MTTHLERRSCPHRDAITCGPEGWLTCLDCGARTPHFRPGDVWQREDGSRVRIQGFSKIDNWIKVREVGGGRERGSYPRTAWDHGFTFIEPEETER